MPAAPAGAPALRRSRVFPGGHPTRTSGRDEDPASHYNGGAMAERTGVLVDAHAGPGVLHQLTGRDRAARGRHHARWRSSRTGRPAPHLLRDRPARRPRRARRRTCARLPIVHGLQIGEDLPGASTASASSSWAAARRSDRSRSAPSPRPTATTSAASTSRWTRSRWSASSRSPTPCARCARLPRARVLVLAGALMGGDIEKAVREVRAQGLLVISLNMAGSVPDAADLVVTRSRAGRRDGGDGRGRDRDVQRRAPQAPDVLDPPRRPVRRKSPRTPRWRPPGRAGSRARRRRSAGSSARRDRSGTSSRVPSGRVSVCASRSTVTGRPGRASSWRGPPGRPRWAAGRS